LFFFFQKQVYFLCRRSVKGHDLSKQKKRLQIYRQSLSQFADRAMQQSVRRQKKE